MDIVSHGLWGGLSFGRKNKRLYWWSFGFGIMPDLFSFGIYTAGVRLGMISGLDWRNRLPDFSAIPSSVHMLYNFTHSLVIFGFVFALVWLLRRKPFLPMLAWALHILVDIPTHSSVFFPTPFLWPISNFGVNGISWGHPIIFYSNVILLVIGYLIWWWLKKVKKQKHKI